MYPNPDFHERDYDDGSRQFNADYSDFDKRMIEANGEEYPGQYYK